jgi:hypothetical protein
MRQHAATTAASIDRLCLSVVAANVANRIIIVILIIIPHDRALANSKQVALYPLAVR